MTLKRLWWCIRLCTIKSQTKRSEYARKHMIYAHLGENSVISSRFVPIYSELISIHDNVRIARNVDFTTHDMIHLMLNRLPENKSERHNFYNLHEHIGCIEIMDNVVIGSNSQILYGTKIGPNVIIAAGSLVNCDCEPNSVYAGVPARKIGTFDDFAARRAQQEKSGVISTTVNNEHLTKEEIESAWRLFNEAHK